MFVASSAHAGISIDLRYGGEYPKYFSGTNCWVFAELEVTGTTKHIAHITIDIGDGTPYNKAFYIVGEPPHAIYKAGAYIGIQFDSTAFSSQSNDPIVVTCVAIDENGQEYSASYSTPLKNNACVLERSDFYNSADSRTSPIVADYLMWGNYELFGNVLGWSSRDYYNYVSEASLSYVHSHGSPSYIRADVDNPGCTHDPPLYCKIFPTEQFSPPIGSVLTAREVAMDDGYPLPPFNPSGNPQISFTFFDTCYTGQFPHFVSHLFPCTNEYNGIYRNWRMYANQAFLSWNISVYIDGSPGYCDKFLEEHITESKTCGEAKDAMTLRYLEWLIEKGFEVEEPTGFTTWATIWGDEDSRARGLYTWSQDVCNAWYQVRWE